MSANPYGPPRAAVDTPLAEQCWREGDVLVMRSGAGLPARCVKCNAPALQPMQEHNVHWHHPGWYALVFINVVVYVIVALIVRRRAKVAFGLCDKHTRRSRMFRVVCLVGAVAGLVLFFALNGLAAALGAVTIGAALIIGLTAGRAAYPARITREEIRLNGCGDAFLNSLEPRAAAAPQLAVAAEPAPKPSGPPGRCPNCDAIIPLDSAECSHCKALFGPGSSWQIRPL